VEGLAAPDLLGNIDSLLVFARIGEALGAIEATAVFDALNFGTPLADVGLRLLMQGLS